MPRVAAGANFPGVYEAVGHGLQIHESHVFPVHQDSNAVPDGASLVAPYGFPIDPNATPISNKYSQQRVLRKCVSVVVNLTGGVSFFYLCGNRWVGLHHFVHAPLPPPRLPTPLHNTNLRIPHIPHGVACQPPYTPQITAYGDLPGDAILFPSDSFHASVGHTPSGAPVRKITFFFSFAAKLVGEPCGPCSCYATSTEAYTRAWNSVVSHTGPSTIRCPERFGDGDPGIGCFAKRTGPGG